MARDPHSLIQLLRVDRGSPRKVGDGVSPLDSAVGMLEGVILHLGTVRPVHGGSLHLGLQVSLVGVCPTLHPAVDGHPARAARSLVKDPDDKPEGASFLDRARRSVMRDCLDKADRSNFEGILLILFSIRGRLPSAFFMCVSMSDKPFVAEVCPPMSYASAHLCVKRFVGHRNAH
jgi:hypothetical protein